MTPRKPSRPAKAATTARTKRKAGRSSGSGDPRGRSRRAIHARAAAVLERLKTEYPDATCALTHRSPYELLVATILSAQCTDARVNMVTPALFERYPTPMALAAARQDHVEEIIRSTGFFRNKARNLIAMAQAVVGDHDGAIPETMAALQQLPGVGRKTANVVLGNAFGINAGVVVDTHVGRIARLLKLTKEKDPAKVERDLMDLFPREDWALLAHLMIFHGRQVCIARRPKCETCTLQDICPSARVGP